jgi:predicted RecA/RadA family phage recombinase
MSKAAYWQRGDTIDYVNSGDDVIEANAILVIGSRIGVAGTDILPGEKGSIHVTGVYEMPKDGAEISAGADVYYSENDGSFSATETEGSVKAGFAAQDAAAGDSSVFVKINA